jgi:hypothetical protein
MSVMSKQESDQIQAPPYDSVDDLDEYSRKGAQIVQVDLSEVPVSALAAVGTFLTAIEKVKGVTVNRSYATMTVNLDLTPAQIAEKLEAANEQLAQDRLKYLTALEFGGPDSNEYGVKESIRRFGKRAGLAQSLPRDPADA